MSEAGALKDKEANREKEIGIILESYLKVQGREQKEKWAVSDEMRTTLTLDASKFYNKLAKIPWYNEYGRLALAVQVALDNNKCAAEVANRDSHDTLALIRLNKEIGNFEIGRIGPRNVEEARAINGVKGVEKPEEYLDSIVSMLVRIGGIDEKKAGRIVEIARETLLAYEEKKGKVQNPLRYSVAAVYYASYKAGSPVSPRDFYIQGVQDSVVTKISTELVRTVRPEELDEWKNRTWPQPYRRGDAYFGPADR